MGSLIIFMLLYPLAFFLAYEPIKKMMGGMMEYLIYAFLSAALVSLRTVLL
jgi:hypothetical protein